MRIYIDLYKKWIEYQCTPDMNWSNIEIDHVKPICSFDVSNNDELKEAFCWKNTQSLLKKIINKKELNLISSIIKKIYIHIDEIWSIDLMDMSDCKISNNKNFRYMFIISDNFSKYTWAIALKNKNSRTITGHFKHYINIQTISH